MSAERHVWHREVVTPAVERVLTFLARQATTRSFYLAGGTALALHLGHRRSVDLDFFTAQSFDQDHLLDALQSATSLAVVGKDEQTLHVNIGGVKVSFLGYVYPLLFPLSSLSGVDVADPRDIACMKISAVASRGTRRDFVDVYAAARQYGMRELLALFQQKYSTAHYSAVHILKSLAYFADAEREPEPDLLVPLTWEDVKQFLQREVSRLSRP